MAEYTASAYEDGTNVFKYQDAAALHPNGTTAQYYRGDGSLATFPTIPPGVTVVQTTGTSTANVMSQKAVTDALNNEASARQEADNNLGQGISDLDQRLTSALSDVYNDLSRSISEGLDNEARARIESINGEGQARYEADQTLGTAIQNLGAVKQDKLTGTIGSVNNPIYLNDGTLTASDLNITRVRAISHNNVLAPNGLLITLPSGYSYSHGSLIVNAAFNGYYFQIMVGFSHSASDGIYQIHAKVHSNNNTNNNYIPTISYYTASNATCYIHLLWADGVTERLRTTLSCNNYDKVTISTAQKPSGVTFTTLAASEIAGLVSVEISNSNLGSETNPVYYNGGGKLYACTGIVNHSAYINTTFNANKEFQIVNGNFTIPLASMKDGVMYNFLVRGYKSTSPVVTWNNNTSNTITFYATNVTSTGTLAAGASKTTVISTYTFKVKNHEISRCVKIGNTVYIDMGY